MEERNRQTPTVPGNGETVESKLMRIADKARKDSKLRFTSLFHLMNETHLRGCYAALRKDAAAGIDKLTKEEYGKELDENLIQLVNKLHRMSYRPQPARRTYIPKAGSDKMRPLGIPALEDKIVQSGLKRIIEAIYEQDFINDSYGFRPGRRQHDALKELGRAVERNRTNYIVEADIKGFFDNVDHDWMMKCLEHRIADTKVLRMVKRFLKAGIMEDGEFKESDSGTPQGGIISPLLANIYLHYVLDIWFERVFKKTCYGYAKIIRYCDDFVVCFESKASAERFMSALTERLGKFSLEVEPTKTKLLEFGKFAQRDAATMKTSELMKKVQAKLRGHYQYYGVSDNSKSIGCYCYEVEKLLHKWLNRRGKRKCMNWEKFRLLKERFPLPRPKIYVSLFV